MTTIKILRNLMNHSVIFIEKRNPVLQNKTKQSSFCLKNPNKESYTISKQQAYFTRR